MKDKIVQVKNYTLRCANKEALRYTATQNNPVAQHLYTLLPDKFIDLPYDLTCQATSLGFLRHIILAYDKLLHNCDVNIIIYYFLNIAVMSKL